MRKVEKLLVDKNFDRFGFLFVDGLKVSREFKLKFCIKLGFTVIG